jgi:hypothetical protein
MSMSSPPVPLAAAEKALAAVPAGGPVRGEVLDPDALSPLALEVAARQRAPSTCGRVYWSAWPPEPACAY